MANKSLQHFVHLIFARINLLLQKCAQCGISCGIACQNNETEVQSFLREPKYERQSYLTWRLGFRRKKAVSKLKQNPRLCCLQDVDVAVRLVT